MISLSDGTGFIWAESTEGSSSPTNCPLLLAICEWFRRSRSNFYFQELVIVQKMKISSRYYLLLVCLTLAKCLQWALCIGAYESEWSADKESQFQSIRRSDKIRIHYELQCHADGLRQFLKQNSSLIGLFVIRFTRECAHSLGST